MRNTGDQCWIKRPFSDWHGFHLEIEYWPGYGFVAPHAVTTNGDARVLREFMNEEDLIDFDRYVRSIAEDRHTVQAKGPR